MIRQVKFHQQYPLKIHVDYPYMAGIIGKRGQFLQKIKHFSGAYLLKVFPTRHETQRKGILVIKHFNIYNCIKAADIALNKLVLSKLSNLISP